MVADCSLKHGVFLFEGVQDGALSYFAFYFESYFAPYLREGSQVGGEFDSYFCRLGHGRVWTSTDSTAGRSWTMGFQVSPALGET